MAFPASVQTQADALAELRRFVIQMKQRAENRSAALNAGNVSGAYIIAMLEDLKYAITLFNATQSVSGISGYAQDQYSDPGLDIAAEFLSMKNAAIAARDWIIANIPENNGYILIRSIDTDGSLIDRQFTPTQTAGLKTLLDTLAATVS